MVEKKDQIVLDMILFVVMSQNNFRKLIKYALDYFEIKHNLLEFLLYKYINKCARYKFPDILYVNHVHIISIQNYNKK